MSSNNINNIIMNNNDKAAEEKSSSSQHQHHHHHQQQQHEEKKQKQQLLWMIKNGRIVVRMLPSEIDRDYEQKQKPGSPVKILPSSVSENTSRGPLEWNPPYPRVARQQQRQQQFQEEEIQIEKEEEKGQVKVHVDLLKKKPPKNNVKLDVYLFPQEQEQQEESLSSSQTTTSAVTDHLNDDVISMTLQRNIDEDAIATIKRLGITISKQLKKRIGKIKKRKKSNNNNKLPSSKGSTTDYTTISFLEATIIQQQQQQDQNSTNNNDTQQTTLQQQQLNLENMTSGELWTIALTKPLTLTFGLSCGDNTDNNKSTTIIKIPFYVECNPPTIISISTYEKFYAKNFPGIPLVIDVKTLWSTNTIVDWYTTADSSDDNNNNNNNSLLVCHNSRCYIPTIHDANKSLKVLITPIRRRQGSGDDDHGDDDHDHHNGEGCQEAYQFQQQIESYLPTNMVLQIRTPTWISPITSNPKNTSSSNNNNNTIRVLTYNILADQNTDLNNNGGDCDLQSHIIDRKYRMPLILYEILSYKADIICLQEVDELIYETLFKPVLVGYYNYQGYCSIKRTRGTKEGSAMFWSLDVFQQQEEEEECNNNKSFLVRNILQDLVYGNKNSVIKEEWDDVATIIRSEIFDKRPDIQHTVCETLGHVLQIAHLKHRRSGKPILIANAHNFFHPIADHVRTLQLIAAAYQLSVESSSSSSSSSSNNNNDNTPFIFCGDFNTSLKNAARIFVERYTPKNFYRHKRHFNTFSWEECDIPPDGYDHDFPELKLPDSFPIVLPAYTIQPDFTHYVVGYKGSLDHIMFTSKFLKKMSSCSSSGGGGEKDDCSNNNNEIVMKVLRCGDMPTEEQVTRYGPAMPNPSYPSDHISLICDIEMAC